MINPFKYFKKKAEDRLEKLRLALEEDAKSLPKTRAYPRYRCEGCGAIFEFGSVRACFAEIVTRELLTSESYPPYSTNRLVLKQILHHCGSDITGAAKLIGPARFIGAARFIGMRVEKSLETK